MTISYRNSVSIATIAFYAPLFLISIYLLIRHKGLSRKSAWFYVCLFCTIRIVGAAFEVATISNPTSTWLYTGYVITLGIAVSPLQLAMLYLLELVQAELRNIGASRISPRMLIVIKLVIIAALALGITGGINASNTLMTTGTYVPQETSKISAILFIVSFVALVALALWSNLSYSRLSVECQRYLLGVLVAMPIFAVRIIYSSISSLANPASFNVVTGNVTLLLCMALIEEYVIVVILETVGLTTRPTDSEKEVSSQAYQGIPLEGEGAQDYQQYRTAWTPRGDHEQAAH